MRPACTLALLLAAALLLGAGRASVSMKNMQYAPATLTIKPGDTVTWTNTDDRDHTVTADDGSFSSENINAGGTFDHRFTKPGTYRYGCKYHPRMKGVVIVKE